MSAKGDISLVTATILCYNEDMTTTPKNEEVEPEEELVWCEFCEADVEPVMKRTFKSSCRLIPDDYEEFCTSCGAQLS